MTNTIQDEIDALDLQLEAGTITREYHWDEVLSLRGREAAGEDGSDVINLSDYQEKAWIETQDPNDPGVQKMIKKSTRVAQNQIKGIFYRYRKQRPDQQLSSVINVVGMMAAELIWTLRACDQGMADVLADALRAHIENAQNGPLK
jgi:hypothetical protein